MKKLCLIAFTALLMPTLSAAQSHLVELSSKLPFSPSSASVMLMSNKGTQEVSNVKIRNVAGNVFAAVVEVPENQSKKGLFASALFSNDEGRLAMSDVIKVTPDSGQSYLSLPNCDLTQNVVVNASTAGQAGLLESLEGIRLAKRNLLRQQLGEWLEPNLQTKLQNIERGFGLQTAAKPITADLAPFEIISRLERIKNSVATYKQSKGAE